jgi:PDZ domain-containing protein
MSGRTKAGLLAVVLVLVMAGLAARSPMPYVTFSPGPTVNVLGKYEKEDIISISRHRVHRDDGALRVTTVQPSGPEDKVSIPELISAWVDPDRAVYPFEAIYPSQATRKSVRQESSVQMVSSQDNAVAAALTALDIPFEKAVKVASVTEDGPADGKLEAGDLVVEANGRKITTLEQLTDVIRPLPVGSNVTAKILRDDRELTRTMTTTTSPQDEKSSALLVTIAPSFEFPLDVELNIDENIGGPSGGLLFALGIYDVLTPGSLTRGKAIAGTGEIDAQGKVGPIGGIQQKLVGAQDDGAELFLVPADNCAEAVDGPYDPDKMRLVKVSTLDDAIRAVETWAEDPKAELARCTR